MDNYDLQVDIGKGIFLSYDQTLIIRKYHLDANEQYIYLTYLNTPCRINRETGGIEEQIGGQWRECRDFSTVMTIYDLLCYHKGEHAPSLYGKWCTVGTFVVTGVTQTDTFTNKYARLFDGRVNQMKAACEKLGGTAVKHGDVGFELPVIGDFKMRILVWAGDDEFPPNAQILYSDNFAEGFAAEDRVVAGDILISTIKSFM